ncbi:MAG: hypothetical protein NTW93_06540 [Phycisphaerae bacterium]|nr:hypothetical protein [Phycisphaerae bacterium]
MMNFLAQLTALINVAANALAGILLAPVAVLPGWLSNTIISAVTGILLLAIFKYTSNQRAIGKTRDDIKASLLALKLFKDSIVVTLQSQGKIFRGAFLLLFHSLFPMLVTIVPICLLLAQMSLYYQLRPLRVGEEAIVTMKLSGDVGSNMPNVSIEAMPGGDVTIGPVKVLSNREIYWKIRACQNGYHKIIFNVDRHQITKELAVGDGFMRVSPLRPGWRWTDILLYPHEKPFAVDSIVQSVSIDYPPHPSRISGTDRWLAYFFVVSMVFALIFKPFLKVKI